MRQGAAGRRASVQLGVKVEHDGKTPGEEELVAERPARSRTRPRRGSCTTSWWLGDKAEHGQGKLGRRRHAEGVRHGGAVRAQA